MEFKIERKITDLLPNNCRDVEIFEIKLTPDECWHIYKLQKEENYINYIKYYVEEDADLLDDLEGIGIDIEEFEFGVLTEFIRNVEKYDMADDDAVVEAITCTLRGYKELK